MLILDKPRALDRMLYLCDRKGNTVPGEFLRPALPLRWTAPTAGRRALADELVLRPPSPAPVDATPAAADTLVEQPVSLGVVPHR